MAYYITIKDKDDYKTIDITNHVLFERLSNFNGDRYSLDELDRFTSNYANMLALKEALLFDGLVDEEEVFKDLSIRMKKNDKKANEIIYDKVMYEPVFKDSKKYLDIYYLTYKIKSLANDFNFLNKLLNHYRNSYINNRTNAYIREFMFGNPELNIYNLLDEFISREIYNYKLDNETGKYVVTSVKYKSLHDLAMFVYNYEHKSTLTKEEINNELKDFIAYLKREGMMPKKEVNIETKKVKKRVRGLVEGQTSFFN